MHNDTHDVAGIGAHPGEPLIHARRDLVAPPLDEQLAATRTDPTEPTDPDPFVSRPPAPWWTDCDSA